jgi:choline-glycine betaine transporter
MSVVTNEYISKIAELSGLSPLQTAIVLSLLVGILQVVILIKLFPDLLDSITEDDWVGLQWAKFNTQYNFGWLLALLLVAFIFIMYYLLLIIQDLADEIRSYISEFILLIIL